MKGGIVCVCVHRPVPLPAEPESTAYGSEIRGVKGIAWLEYFEACVSGGHWHDSFLGAGNAHEIIK